MTVSGGTIDLSWTSCTVEEGGSRLDARTTLGFLRICTVLASAVSGLVMCAVFGVSVWNSSARSCLTFAAACFAFLIAFLPGESVTFPRRAIISLNFN